MEGSGGCGGRGRGWEHGEQVRPSLHPSQLSSKGTPEMGWGVPSTVQNQQSKEPPTKGDLRELVAEGVFQACFQHSIFIESNTSPFVGCGLEMRVYVWFS